MFTELIINGEIYKLRLTTKASVLLERTLGYSPITLFMDIEKGKMPKLNDVLVMFQATLTTYHHNMTMDKVYVLFDEYVAEGGSMISLLQELANVLEQSGYIPKTDKTETEVEEKN